MNLNNDFLQQLGQSCLGQFFLGLYISWPRRRESICLHMKLCMTEQKQLTMLWYLGLKFTDYIIFSSQESVTFTALL